jgi:hypothetical protein
MIKDLVEAILPLFKISGGFAEILYLLCFWRFWHSWSLSCSSRRVFAVSDFWSCACNPSIAIA